MKKVLLLLFTVGILIGAVLWADRLTRIKTSVTAKGGGREARKGSAGGRGRAGLHGEGPRR